MPANDPISIGLAGLVGQFGDLAPLIERELRLGWHFERVMTRARQKEIAKAQMERKTVEGLGQVMMSVDPTAYHFWGQKLGYQCWKDKTFRREFARDNPEVRVKTEVKAIGKGMDFKAGKSEASHASKFRKSYGELKPKEKTL